MPEDAKPQGPLAGDEFLALPVEQRLAIYLGLATATISDVSKVSDQELRLLGYGMSGRDQEVREFVGPDEWDSMMYPVRLTSWESDDKGAYAELMSAETISPESLQVPLSVVGIVGAVYGGAAVGGAMGFVGPTGTVLSGAAGAGASVGSMQASISAAVMPSLMVAAKVLNSKPSLVVRSFANKLGRGARWVGRAGGATSIVTGFAGVQVAFWNEMTGTDEAELARADAIAERSNYEDAVKSVDDGYSQDEIDARQAYMGNPPSLGAPADTTSATRSGSLDASIASYKREAGLSTNAGSLPPPQQPASGSDLVGGVGTDLVGTPPPIGNEVVDPNADDPFVGGVGEGYVATNRVDQQPEMYGRSRDTKEQAPQYRMSDFANLAATMTEATIDRFQQLMVRAGYMSEEQANGLMDTKTIDTLKTVLYESNLNGENWVAWSTNLAEEGDRLAAEEDAASKQRRLDAIGPFQRQVYLEPDYATLTVAAKDAIEKSLGRKVNAWEVEMLAGQLSADYRSQYDAEVQADRYAYDDQVRAVEEDLGLGDTVGGQTVERVDPAARFQETFDAKFRKELDRKEVTMGATVRTDRLMQGLNNAMGVVSR